LSGSKKPTLIREEFGINMNFITAPCVEFY